MGSDSFGGGWVGCRKDYSWAVGCCQNEWLLVKYMFRGQRFGIGEGFDMNDRPIYLVLFKWVVDFVLFQCMFGVGKC
jgi:hypothetical protein